jgi:hypothetical protein
MHRIRDQKGMCVWETFFVEQEGGMESNFSEPMELYWPAFVAIPTSILLSVTLAFL